jgi:hypothetical protein
MAHDGAKFADDERVAISSRLAEGLKSFVEQCLYNIVLAPIDLVIRKKP